MKLTTMLKNTKAAVLLLAAIPAMAQYSSQPPLLAPQELDNLVARIALYPDPLLAQVLAAATFPDQIQDAARWAYDHRGLRGDDLADRIANSNLPWDPSVQALLPFPEVLDTMARDMDWTVQLGDAFLAQRYDVMDAVQRMRQAAANYGYLQSNEQVRVVNDPGYIQILPYDPAVIYVPAYDPWLVYAPPRPGFYAGTAIRFSRGCAIGFGFTRWGWGGGFDWRARNVVVGRSVWNRDWHDRRRDVVIVNNHQTVIRREPMPLPTYRRDNTPDRGWQRPDREARPMPAPLPERRAEYRPQAPRVEQNYRQSAPASQPRMENNWRHENVRQEAPRGHESGGMSRGGGGREGHGRGR